MTKYVKATEAADEISLDDLNKVLYEEYDVEIK